MGFKEAFNVLPCLEKFCFFFMCRANFLVTVSGIGIFISVSDEDLLRLPGGNEAFSLDKVMVGVVRESLVPP